VTTLPSSDTTLLREFTGRSIWQQLAKRACEVPRYPLQPVLPEESGAEMGRDADGRRESVKRLCECPTVRRAGMGKSSPSAAGPTPRGDLTDRTPTDAAALAQRICDEGWGVLPSCHSER